MLEMNPEIREQWCAALRSGEYRQTTGTLRKVEGTDARYCCLGVLTDLYVKDGGAANYVPSWVSNGATEHIWDDNTLPEPVVNWAGLDGDDNPVLQDMSGEYHLASGWNDEYGADFAMIADMIDGGKS